jgi:hypothetical protein
MFLLKFSGLPTLPVEVSGDVGFEVDVFKIFHLTLRLVPQTIQEDGRGSFVMLVVLWTKATVVH